MYCFFAVLVTVAVVVPQAPKVSTQVKTCFIVLLSPMMQYNKTYTVSKLLPHGQQLFAHG